MFISIILSTWGPRANSDYYAKLEVSGGNGPFFWHTGCPLGPLPYSVNKNITIIGCLTNSTWNQAAMGFLREAFWDNCNPDPNLYTSMYKNR
jgi:hypothetical protein